MKAKNYIFSTLFLLSIGCMSMFAQMAKYETGGSIGSGDADEPRFAVLDSENNYYIAGFGKGVMAIDGKVNLTGRGAQDALLVKYNEDMEIQWARYVGGTRDEIFEGVAVASNGQVYAVGKNRSTSMIDGTEELIPAVNDQDGMMVVFDKDGNYKMHKVIAGTADVDNGISGNAICYGVVIDGDDNIYVAGSTIGNTDFGNGKSLTPATSKAVAYIAKYNLNLECQWVIEGSSGTESTSVDWPMAITLDKDKNIVVVGRYAKQIDITGTNGVTVSNATAGTSTGFVSKINPAGECRWVKAIASAGGRIDTKGVACDSKGNVGVIGFADGAITPEGGSQYAYAAGIDMFFVRLSPSGGYIDGFGFGGAGRDEGKSIAFDSNDNVYLAGNMNGPANTGTVVNMNPKGSTPVEKTFYGHDGFYAKYDAETLELIQVEKTATPSKEAKHEVVFNVLLSKDDCKVYTLGYFNDANTLFDGEGGSVTLPHAGNYDLYWSVYSSCFSIKTASLPNAQEGTMYFASIEVVNAAGNLTYSILRGSLPPGITMDPSGSISGTPTERGKFEFTVKVEDESNMKEKDFSIIVTDKDGCDVFIKSDFAPDGHLNTPYSFQFDIAGEGFTCTVKSGTLPAGLTLSEGGLLSGTPTGNEGLFRFVVEARKDETCADEIDIAMIIEPGSGLNEPEALSQFVLYPLPAQGQFTLNTVFGQPSDVDVRIIMPTGVSIWSKAFTQTSGINETIQVSDFASGVYFVVLNTREGTAVRRLIVK